eukprot:12905406-Prorocentrum_lima.AAC.1
MATNSMWTDRRTLLRRDWNPPMWHLRIVHRLSSCVIQPSQCRIKWLRREQFWHLKNQHGNV